MNVGALINAQADWMFRGSVTMGIGGDIVCSVAARSSKAVLSRSVYAVGIRPLLDVICRVVVAPLPKVRRVVASPSNQRN